MKLPKIIQDTLSHYCTANEESFGHGWWYINNDMTDDVIAFLLLTGASTKKFDGEVTTISIDHKDKHYLFFATGSIDANDSLEDNTRDQINIVALAKYLRGN